MNSILKYILPALSFVLLTNGCKKLPDYSEVPSIEFGGFEIYRNHYSDLSSAFADSVVVKIKFKDGDGDLGLDEEDKKNDTLPNFIMRSHWKNNSPFIDSVVYKGQFQPLTLSAKNIRGPLDGELRYSVIFPYPNYNPRDTVKFSITIKDRAGNFSNEVTSENFIINDN